MSIRTSHITTFPGLISHWALSFSIGMALLTIMNLVVQHAYTWRPELAPSQIFIGLAAAISPLIVRKNEKKITLVASLLLDIASESEHKTFLGNQIRIIQGSMGANVLPSAITSLGLLSLLVFGSPWRSVNPIAHVLFSIFVLVFFFVAGSLGWQYIVLISMLYAASTSEIEANIFTWPARQIKKLNQIILEIYLAGVLIYIGAILAVWSLPWGKSLLTNDNLFTNLWVFPIAIIVIGYFLAIQYLIHRLFSTLKDSRLEKIDRKLESLSNETNNSVQDEKIRFISELINWRKVVDAQPEWPLNLQTFLGVIGSVLLPTIVSVSELFLKFVR